MKILIVAQNASTRLGGEAILPVHYFRILYDRGYDVHLIAHSRNEKDLVEHLSDRLSKVIFIPDSILQRIAWNTGRRFPNAIRVTIFGNLLNFINERFQAKIIKRLIREEKVDIIHQPIPVSPKAPSSIHGFGLPVIIGPMNGGMSFPEGYEDYQGYTERKFVAFGRAVATLMNLIIPGKKRATTLLVSNQRTKKALPRYKYPNVIELVENGVVLSTWNTYHKPTTNQELRLAFMGRLVDWKAIDFTLHALKFARQKNPCITLDILGDGDQRARLEELAVELGLENAVTIHGFLPQSACADILAERDALVLNSLYECGGAVVLEAMSVGLPVIASDWGGPADYIDPSCGILVDPRPRETFASRLADAFLQLANNPTMRAEMGKAGAEKIRREFDWERKVDRMIEIYTEAILLHDAKDVLA